MSDRPQGNTERKWQVDLSKDKLQAYLHLDLEESDTLSVKQIKEILSQHQVVYGIDEEIIRKIADSPKDYDGQSTLIAQGNPRNRKGRLHRIRVS